MHIGKWLKSRKNNHSIDMSVQRATKIVNDWGAYLEKHTPSAITIYDSSLLPHRKSDIFCALLVCIQNTSANSSVEILRTGVIFLAQFQASVGSTPLHMLGTDVAELQPMQSLKQFKQEVSRIAVTGRADRDRYDEFNLLVQQDMDRMMLATAEAADRRTMQRST